jgi:hypothetical protein
MSESMEGKNISPAEKFPALCGKGCTTFHTIHVRRINLCERCINSDVRPVNFDERCINSDVRPVNFDERCINFDVRPVNFDERCINSDERPVNFDERCINLCERCINFDVRRIHLDERPVNLHVRPINLLARRKNLRANHINPRAACIYHDAVCGKPNAPALICLRIFSTNKAAAYSHDSTADLNKTWLMNVKVPVDPCKYSAEINH